MKIRLTEILLWPFALIWFLCCAVVLFGESLWLWFKNREWRDPIDHDEDGH